MLQVTPQPAAGYKRKPPGRSREAAEKIHRPWVPRKQAHRHAAPACWRTLQSPRVRVSAPPAALPKAPTTTAMVE
eukprot:3377756-Prymnesium_polylepis.1